MTKPSPLNSVQLAAQEIQEHVQKMTGAVLPISTVGNEGSYPGKCFVYVGPSAATTAAGISTSGLTIEHYIIRTIATNLYIVGRDAGDDDWADLSDCQPGTLLGTYHFLQEALGVNWIWPGESGTVVLSATNITLPSLDITTGPSLEQRKYRTPRIGLYRGGSTNYGFGIPVLPTNGTLRVNLANTELRWLRRMRMGSRKSPSFAHSFTTWWSTYGATHPEYFAELLPGRTQPHPSADRVKLHVSGSDVWQAKINEWMAAGTNSFLNISPNDSRSHCVCSSCLAWDRPAQAAEIVFDSSDAKLGDRYARFYTEIANMARAIKSNTTVCAMAYDVFRNAPIEAMLPTNVAIAYVPGAPSDTLLDGISETETNVLGWIAHGCTQMYLRPNWMLSAHAGPFWPTHRLGEHFKRMLLSGNIKGLDSDSSCSSYACFGFYYYLVCRLIADPTLEVDAIVDDFCSAFGSAAPRVRDYLAYWENFIYNQADAGSTDILGWATCMAAYPDSYTDRVFDGAQQILDAAYASLSPSETNECARLDFLKTACLHGRLTAQAIALVDPVLPLSSNPEAERAMRSLLAYRNQHAESFAIWREWMIDREHFVPNMQSYWEEILATPEENNGSNIGAFIETNGEVVIEAEHFTAKYDGTGAASSNSWQEVTGPSGSSGTVMQSQPNIGVGTDTGRYGPRLDFKVDFRMTGTYCACVRIPTLLGSDDSINIGLDGALLASNLGNTTGSWRWRTNQMTIATAGVHTFNIWMREDGSTVDKIIITTNSSFSLPGSDPGPAESAKRGNTERLLTVVNGTGDGWYGEATLVPITAYTPPTDYVFDRWTGDTQFLANALAATTYAQISNQDMRVTATYKLSPIVDADGDGIADLWETTKFGNTTTANATTDTDGDGNTDLMEYLAGTEPQSASSNFKVSKITANANGDIVVEWPAVSGKTYTLLVSADLTGSSWTPIAVGIAATPPTCTYTVRMNMTRGFLRVQVE